MSDISRFSCFPALSGPGFHQSFLEVLRKIWKFRLEVPQISKNTKLSIPTASREPLQPEFEHALFVVEGSSIVEGEALERGTLLYLGTRRGGLRIDCGPDTRTMLIGGAPFGEPVLMWWNFVAREAAEIEQARADWEAGRRFAKIPEHDGRRVPAPALLNSARD